MTRLYAQSVEYVRIPVTAVNGAGTALNLSGDTVQVAATRSNASPTVADWRPAVWDNGQARILIGGPDFTLTPGDWNLFVKVTDNPELPVLRAGTLTVT